MALRISDFWSWRGSVGRKKYFAMGVTLFAIKHFADRLIATLVFGQPWGLFNYWVVEDEGAVNIPSAPVAFYATLLVVAMPFIWTGLVLTLRRLRDVGWPLWLVALFFVPFINLLFFLVLSTVPPRDADEVVPRVKGLRGFLDKLIPKSRFGSAVVGVVLTSLLTIGATALSVEGLGNYGWGLFVGLPFFLGLTSVLVYGYHGPRSIGRCLLVSLASVAVAGGALIAIAFEGLICVLMAAPLGAIFALFGGTVGYIIQDAPRAAAFRNSFNAFAVVLFALPLSMWAESAAQPEPPLLAVRTSVEIDAPPEKVWNHLVAFAEIPPPTEWLFKTGIAYPIRAEIEGQGVGAVRRCVFSTGPFVEPIEVWDEPVLLRFGVTEQPDVMEELSPYSGLRPPHLDDYLRSRRGQFLLVPLDGGKTLLEGTTWYQNRYWPAPYWKLWSDQIIHRIHLRVLEHIKYRSELQPPA